MSPNCVYPSFSRFGEIFLLLIKLLVLNNCSIWLVCGYSCETPEKWLETAAAGVVNEIPLDKFLQNDNAVVDRNGTTADASFRQGQKWPEGVVKYKFHPSLSVNDIVEVNKAFDEYHRKTCIRFEPWKEGDLAYTSIETDNTLCGRGHVCMQGGYQYAKFGKSCRQMDTMIHELGHNLCMDHEQNRPDRDWWINFDDCSESELQRYRNWKRDNPINGIYDYYSQMHYECGSCQGGWPTDKNVNRCGSQITTGLSLLDADLINEMYNCQGCFRHRWKRLQFLTTSDRKFMYSFGYTDINGYAIYPCRAFYGGEIVTGKYIHEFRKCFIPFDGVEHAVTENVQVLTIPGGLDHITEDGSVTHRYELASIRSISMTEIAKVGIPSGRTLDSTGGTDAEGVGFIAFGTLALEDAGSGKSVMDAIGNVWRRTSEDFAVAQFAVLGKQQSLDDNFKVLVCRHS